MDSGLYHRTMGIFSHYTSPRSSAYTLIQPSNFILTRVPAHSMSFPFKSPLYPKITTYLLVILQSGSPSSKSVGQSFLSVSQVHRHMSKCSLFDLLSVSSKPVTGQLSTLSLEAGTTSVNHSTRQSEPQLENLLILDYITGELGKRNDILQSSVSIAPVFSGFLQAGVYDSPTVTRVSLAGDGFLVSPFWTLKFCFLTQSYSHQRCYFPPNRCSRLLLLARCAWDC